MPEKDSQTSLEKALDVCEALAGMQRGLSVSELARLVRQPAPTVHRLLGILKRRGFVRQDDDTARYSLTLKMLDLSFRVLGRSELRLHAYPVLREFVLRSGVRSFIAVPGAGEVTYLWRVGPDEVGMYTTYGREMPVHDYTGRQVARVGVFTHAADERPFAVDQTAVSMELARRISLRLGHLTESVALGA